MAKHKPQFTIIKTEEFIQKCDGLSKVYGRITDLINAACWNLERKRHLYLQISTEYYLWRSSVLANPAFPQVKVMYRIIEAENKVILIDIDDDLS
jgi:hypothetical protein